MKQHESFDNTYFFPMKEFLPSFGFYRRSTQLFIFADLKPLSAAPTDHRWIHWPDFYHIAFEFFSYASVEVIELDDLIQKNQGHLAVKKGIHLGLQEPRMEDFQIIFRHLEGLFSSGQIQKAVPTIHAFSSIQPQAEQIQFMIEALLELPESLHVYGIITPELSMIGASPEYLFQIHGQQLKSLAVAGTRLQSNLSENDFLNHPKDRKEHDIVVEDILKKLNSIHSAEFQGFGTVNRGKTYIKSFHQLMHLVTELSMELGPTALTLKQLYFIVKALHPTAALGLYSSSMFWKEAQYFPGADSRHPKFGAPLTFSFGPSDIISIVGIRNLIWDKRGSFLSSGCGIIQESQLDNEWRELYDKRKAVMKMLRIDK